MPVSQLFGIFLATTRRAGWAPAAVLLLHLGLVYGFDAYERFSPLDIPMHFLGGAAMAYLAEHLYREGQRGGALTVGAGFFRALLLVSFAALAAVLWELAELASDRYLGTRYQVSLADTMRDLFMGLLGAVTYLLLRPRGPAASPDHGARKGASSRG